MFSIKTMASLKDHFTAFVFFWLRQLANRQGDYVNSIFFAVGKCELTEWAVFTTWIITQKQQPGKDLSRYLQGM